MRLQRFVRAGALLLVACGEPAVNSTSQVEIRVVNSTGLSDVVVTVSWLSDDGGGSSTQTGEETTEHTCHVHPDAVGNEDNVPTAVI